MPHRLLVLTFAAAFIAAACGNQTGQSGAPAGTGPAGTGPAGTAAGFDPSTVTGDITLGAWESSPAEGEALAAALEGFAEAYPNINVEQQTVAGDYRVQMTTNFSAGTVQDIFWVNAEYAPEWIEEGFLEPLDPFIEQQGFDTSAFFPGYLDTFKGPDGVQYALPKDGNTIAMGYNSDLVTTPPTTLEELVATADSLKGQGDLKAPICINPGLDRGLAFIYAQGGSLLTEDNSAAAIDSAESTAAVQWYLDLVKNGQAQTPTQLGDDWCGAALGLGDVAIAFEGGWLKGAMENDFPDTNWAFAEMPAGTAGKATISYTAAYAINPDSENKDAAWVLMQYMTGPDGMQLWTEGGIAVPSRGDVPVPEGFEVIVAGGEYAKPGSGFMPGYGGAEGVQTIFTNAFNAEITNETYSAGPVIAATKAKIDEILGG